MASLDVAACVGGIFIFVTIAAFFATEHVVTSRELLIILGIYSRIGALMVVVNMMFAVMLAHGAQLFMLSKSGGWALELQAFYLFTGLALCFMGSGRMAVKPD